MYPERKRVFPCSLPSRMLALSTLGLGGYQPCPFPTSKATPPPAWLSLSPQGCNPAPGPHHKVQPSHFGLPALGGEFHKAVIPPQMHLLAKLIPQTSSGRVLAEWVTFPLPPPFLSNVQGAEGGRGQGHPNQNNNKSSCCLLSASSEA